MHGTLGTAQIDAHAASAEQLLLHADLGLGAKLIDQQSGQFIQSNPQLNLLTEEAPLHQQSATNLRDTEN